MAPSDDGGVHPTRILNVNTVETYDLYENRFIYHLIQRLLTFVDKRTDVIFWSTGNEIRNRFKMHSKIDDAYEEIEYNVEMTVKTARALPRTTPTTWTSLCASTVCAVWSWRCAARRFARS